MTKIPTNWLNTHRNSMNNLIELLDSNSDLIIREDLSEYEIKYSFSHNSLDYCCYIHKKYISIVYRILPNFPITQNTFFKNFNEYFDLMQRIDV